MKAVTVFLALTLALMLQPARAQSPAPGRREALAALNRLRAENGVPALAANAQLDAAAQRHADDMAAKRFVDSVGSDGSSGRQRIEAAGYPGWNGARPWAESIYAGQALFDDALQFLANDEGQRRALFSPRFREVGIGIASDGVRTYWVVTYSSQPNVLPITINDGAPITNDPQVAIQLTQEEAVPIGDARAIGSVVDVRLSSSPDFAKAEWQPWERLIPFTFDRKSGEKAIYVEMRDAAGRTAMSRASILLDTKAKQMVTPLGPGAVETVAIPTEPPLVIETPTAAVEPAHNVASAPGATSTAVQVNALVIASTPAPPAIPAEQLIPTPIRIATEPAPQPQGAFDGDLGPTSSIVSAEVEPTPVVRPLFQPRDQTRLPQWLLPIFVSLQTLVIIGALVRIILRRR